MIQLPNISRVNCLKDLMAFRDQYDKLAIVERRAPSEAECFFQELMEFPFGVAGKVRKESAEADIKDILNGSIPLKLQNNPFYDEWVDDMAEVSKSFCDIQKKTAAGFWLGSERSCSRYHIDNVPLRALVTYAGKGTEYLPDEAADLRAYADGEPNEKIIKDRSFIRFINSWDVAVFKGGSKGLLHRTPDEALNGPSILMRLDYPSFWDHVLK